MEKTLNYWKRPNLTERDNDLLNQLGIKIENLVFDKHQDIWLLFDKSNLTRDDISRIKSIRKREKNRLITDGEMDCLSAEIEILNKVKVQLLEEQEILTKEIEMFRIKTFLLS